jgi:hypothetical protein
MRKQVKLWSVLLMLVLASSYAMALEKPRLLMPVGDICPQEISSSS